MAAETHKPLRAEGLLRGTAEMIAKAAKRLVRWEKNKMMLAEALERLRKWKSDSVPVLVPSFTWSAPTPIDERTCKVLSVDESTLVLSTRDTRPLETVILDLRGATFSESPELFDLEMVLKDGSKIYLIQKDELEDTPSSASEP